MCRLRASPILLLSVESQFTIYNIHAPSSNLESKCWVLSLNMHLVPSPSPFIMRPTLSKCLDLWEVLPTLSLLPHFLLTICCIVVFRQQFGKWQPRLIPVTTASFLTGRSSSSSYSFYSMIRHAVGAKCLSSYLNAWSSSSLRWMSEKMTLQPPLFASILCSESELSYTLKLAHHHRRGIRGRSTLSSQVYCQLMPSADLWFSRLRTPLVK